MHATASDFGLLWPQSYPAGLTISSRHGVGGWPVLVKIAVAIPVMPYSNVRLPYNLGDPPSSTPPFLQRQLRQEENPDIGDPV